MRGIYLVGGYPDRETFRQCLCAVLEAGPDFVEVGIPFNDPVADGARSLVSAAAHEEWAASASLCGSPTSTGPLDEAAGRVMRRGSVSA